MEDGIEQLPPLVERGRYAVSTVYGVGDVVTALASRWVAITAFTSGTAFDMSKWLKLGQTAYTPTAANIAVEVTDNFNRANGNLAAPWTRYCSFSGANFAVASNMLTTNISGAADDSTDCYLYSTPLSMQYQCGRALLPTINDNIENVTGVALRGSSTIALVGGIVTNGWRIQTFKPGGGSTTKTVFAGGTGTFSGGGSIEFRVNGTTATLLYHGVILGGVTADLPTGSLAGPVLTRSNQQLDDFQAGTWDVAPVGCPPIGQRPRPQSSVGPFRCLRARPALSRTVDPQKRLASSRGTRQYRRAPPGPR